MNTRQSFLKQAKDLQIGDIIDFRFVGNGYGLKHHIVESLPTYRTSVPSEVCFLCRVYDPENKLPDNHEGVQSTSAMLNANSMIRICLQKPKPLQTCW